MDAPKIDKAKLSLVLATDCGSTTTKAILFEKRGDGWHTAARGEAPTTVEKPLADVTIGARNSFSEVQELSGRKILRDSASDDEETSPLIIRDRADQDTGVDLYISTSSAGGGLQMVVLGVVGAMTAESAERAALGAGAIVMDSVSIDDGREQYEHVEKIRHLRPDICLIAGGTDGGTIEHPLQLAETLLQADPRPRFGDTLRLPVVFAANIAARDQAKEILDRRFSFISVDNLRPTLETENLAPARDAIHELFLSHVMSHAPGYRRLLSWSPVPILPTPAAVGNMVLDAAYRSKRSIVAVDIGGATTDVFSALRPTPDSTEFVFNRTVSANLGMSYSVANVLIEAGAAQIARWLPFDFDLFELADRLRNKMIRPTSIPQTIEDLLVEQAVCREALRLAFAHHRRLASGLKGMRSRRTIGDLFKQQLAGDSLVNMKEIDLIIGSGGVLSHAPDRRSSALMMIDAFEPEGCTALAVDSIFMMPHLGVLSSIHPEAAAQIFERDCLISLGSVIAPTGNFIEGEPVLDLELSGQTFSVKGGDLTSFDLPSGDMTEVLVKPRSRFCDVGKGAGVTATYTVRGGAAGLIIDARGRPLRFALDRTSGPAKWHSNFGLKVS